MATKREHEVAERIIAMLKEHGYSYDEMIPVIRLAKEKFKRLTLNK